MKPRVVVLVTSRKRVLWFVDAIKPDITHKISPWY